MEPIRIDGEYILCLRIYATNESVIVDSEKRNNFQLPCLIKYVPLNFIHPLKDNIPRPDEQEVQLTITDTKPFEIINNKLDLHYLLDINYSTLVEVQKIEKERLGRIQISEAGRFLDRRLKDIKKTQQAKAYLIDWFVQKGQAKYLLKNEDFNSKYLNKFPIIPFIQWKDVTFNFISEDAIQIKAGGITKSFTNIELGFKDKRTVYEISFLWDILLDIVNNGEISKKSPSTITIKNLNVPLMRIRKILNNFMSIERDDPIPWDRKNRCWKPKFKYSLSPELTEYLHSK